MISIPYVNKDETRKLIAESEFVHCVAITSGIPLVHYHVKITTGGQIMAKDIDDEYKYLKEPQICCLLVERK